MRARTGSRDGGVLPRFEAFEDAAWEQWERIPEAYKEGVDGLVVERGAKAHPSLPDIYTLGECATEAYPSEFGGPETIRSYVVLYYGSFLRLSRLDPEFDWEEELWETLTHELRHHLESLAAEDALEDVDYAADENFKRLNGEPFDPFFFRSGDRLGADLWGVEDDVFLERPVAGAPVPGAPVEFDWVGRRYRVAVPAHPGDVTYIVVDGVDSPPAGELCIVLVRRWGVGDTLRRFLRRAGVTVEEAEARAEPVDAPGAGS